jgi:predicted transcriptional regulator
MKLFEGKERSKTLRRLAKEFLTFRQNNLFRQSDLADALQTSRRTIQMVEAGRSLAHVHLQRKFQELKDKHSKRRSA